MGNSEETHNSVKKGTRMAIEDSVKVLETVTKNLGTNFPTLNASSIPEYQTAIDAIRGYKEAVVRRMDEEYAKE